MSRESTRGAQSADVASRQKVCRQRIKRGLVVAFVLGGVGVGRRSLNRLLSCVILRTGREDDRFSALAVIYTARPASAPAAK